MTHHPNSALIVGAALSASAVLMHLCVIVGGASWYRFFGAGERMARAASARRAYPAIVTGAIALVLLGWVAYALSGAGVLAPLPLLKPVLCAITGIYLLRGSVIVPIVLLAPRKANLFLLWSSAICLVFGGAHLIGLWQVWAKL
jgi:hypothetical protein